MINAFNNNMPFDQFTVEQIAGDLLPNATPGPEDRHRIQPQPSRQRRGRHHPRGVRRRVRRGSRGDHGHGVARPDDGLRPLPRPQVRSDHAEESFTSSSPIFNNVPERGRAIKYGNSPPLHQGSDRPSSRQQLATSMTKSDCRSGDAFAALRMPQIATSTGAPGRNRMPRSEARSGRVSADLLAQFATGRRRASRTLSSHAGRAASSQLVPKSARPSSFDGKRLRRRRRRRRIRLPRQVHARRLGLSTAAGRHHPRRADGQPRG